MQEKIKVTGTVLKTPRLILRPFEQGDLQDFYSYAKVDGVGQPAGWSPHQSLEETRRILDIFLAQKIDFAIEENGRVIGSFGLHSYPEDKFPQFDALRVTSIGYVLAKDRWGNGLMTEAGRAVLQWLFEVKNIDVVVCGHFLSNPRSGRVKEKLGFRPAVTYPMHTRAGRDEMCEEGILTRDEWEKANH